MRLLATALHRAYKKRSSQMPERAGANAGRETALSVLEDLKAHYKELEKEPVTVPLVNQNERLSAIRDFAGFCGMN